MLEQFLRVSLLFVNCNLTPKAIASNAEFPVFDALRLSITALRMQRVDYVIIIDDLITNNMHLNFETCEIFISCSASKLNLALLPHTPTR